MIITESFVWINYPKTASTFVRESLRSLYDCEPLNFRKRWRMRNRWIKEIDCPNLRPTSGNRYGTPTPHGTITQIPEAYRNLPIASAFRDLFSRYLSLYNYADWKNPAQYPASLEAIRLRFPTFPDLDFRSYLQYVRHFYGNAELRVGVEKFSVGPLSIDFLRFFTQPKQNTRDWLGFDSWAQIQHELSRITFLNTSHINQELQAWLSNFRYSEKDLEFLQQKAPSNVSKVNSDGRELDSTEIEELENIEWVFSRWLRAPKSDLAEVLMDTARSHSLPL